MTDEESAGFVLDVFAEKMPTTAQNYICWSLDLQSRMLDFMADYGLLEVFLDRLLDPEAAYIYAVNECHIAINELENRMDAISRGPSSKDEKPRPPRPERHPQ